MGHMEQTAIILLLAATLALLIGIVLLHSSQRRRQRLGLPNGDVFYQDHQEQPMHAVALLSRVSITFEASLIASSEPRTESFRLNLKKSVRPPSRGGVYPNHLIQVLAYIVLVREHYEPVPYGLVVYGDQAARKVLPTPENLTWFAQVVDQVRLARGLPQLDRSHHQRNRCRGCGLKHTVLAPVAFVGEDKNVGGPIDETTLVKTSTEFVN